MNTHASSSVVIPPTDFWKRKLAAFLHDPPHKPFAIAGHEEARTTPLVTLGMESDALLDWDRRPDWQAAAADRFTFPKASRLYVDWKRDNGCAFQHPLGGASLKPTMLPPTAAQGEDWINSALAGIPAGADEWKTKFVRTWRLWPERCAREKSAALAYLVADTRIPDHTLWHHNGIASAFESAGAKPALLLFQLGPVQDFIAAARKTIDLWSASYLLSYLTTQGALAIADSFGPDAIIYPNLRGLPLADWHWWKTGVISELGRASHPDDLLTPATTNRFLALVPSDWRNAAGDGPVEIATKAVRTAWIDIASSVHAEIAKTVADQAHGWDVAWAHQVSRFPQVDAVLHPWNSETGAIHEAALANEPVPPLAGGWSGSPLAHHEAWRSMMPSEDRESFHGTPTAGYAWSLHYAVTDWLLAARKSSRGFAPWSNRNDAADATAPKDHLDGRNEVLGGSAHEAFWDLLRSKYPTDFKGSQLYGAITVIKRLWWRTYLGDNLGWQKLLGRCCPTFESVQDIAAKIENDDAGDESYYAILAMDGDDLGKWLGGVKTPLLKTSLAPQAYAYFADHWKPECAGGVKADIVRRPLSPGFHAALSEALSNFSLHCAGQIVEAFGGQLLYSGGDDVLAMLPTNSAVDCAQALQQVFRGLAPDERCSREVKAKLESLFEFPADGFVRCRKGSGSGEHQRPNWPIFVPGPQASASIGISIGHVRSPMQDVIRAARSAEDAAKRIPDKGALCVRVAKRSGESAEWAAPFASQVLPVWHELTARINDPSGRLPYRFLQLAKPLLASPSSTDGEPWMKEWTPDLRDAVTAELAHVLRQQARQCAPDASNNAARWMTALTDCTPSSLNPAAFLRFWMAWAFLNRLGR